MGIRVCKHHDDWCKVLVDPTNTGEELADVIKPLQGNSIAYKWQE